MQISYELNSIQGIPLTSPNGVTAPSRDNPPKYTEPEDHVTISKKARDKSKKEGVIRDDKDLDSEEKQRVTQLKKRDAEVKAHEAAHMAAGGPVVQGGASYQYERGPDGKNYAVGGEVKIDMSPERTPEATIRKMQQVKQAALAPAQPSGTDRAVAARAAQIEANARAEHTESLNKPQAEEQTAESQEATETQGPAQSDQSQGANKAKTGIISAYKIDMSPPKKSFNPIGTRINLSV